MVHAYIIYSEISASLSFAMLAFYDLWYNGREFHVMSHERIECSMWLAWLFRVI